MARSGGLVLSGTGLPSDRLGTTGDFYIRTVTDQLFGPKTIRIAEASSGRPKPEGHLRHVHY
jgi:hypothetical protein